MRPNRPRRGISAETARGVLFLTGHPVSFEVLKALHAPRARPPAPTLRRLDAEPAPPPAPIARPSIEEKPRREVRLNLRDAPSLMEQRAASWGKDKP